MKLKASKFANFSSVDGLIKKIQKNDRSVEIDLSGTVWADTLALCSLNMAMLTAADCGVEIEITLPTSPGSILSFINNTNLIHAWKRHNFRIIKTGEGITPSSDSEGIAYELFSERSELDSYLNELEVEDISRHLLRSKNTPDFLKTTTFRSIILKELIENCFDHGKGDLAQYCISQLGPSSRDDHKIFRNFSGKGFLEICVGDSNEKNIAETIGEHVPDEFQDMVIGGKHAPRTVGSILYAFEFHATSNPDKRERLLEAFFKSSDVYPDEIATGLFNVKAVAETYGAQIIVRLSDVLVSLDFSQGDMEVQWLSGLSEIKGSIISIRLPTTRLGERNYVGPLMHIPTPTSRGHSVPAADSGDITLEAFVFNSQSHFTKEIFDQIINRITKISNSKKQVMYCVYLPHMEFSTKIFGGFLQVILRMKGAKSVVLVFEGSQYVKTARDEWAEISRKNETLADEFRFPGYSLLSGNPFDLCQFGIQIEGRSTDIIDGNIRHPSGEVLSSEFILSTCREKYIKEYITSPPTYHENGFFFIENTYYTQKFYETRRLLSTRHVRLVFGSWLLEKVKALSPKIVFVNAHYLLDFFETTLGVLGDQCPIISHLTSKNTASSLVEASSACIDGGTILFFSDVICKGRNITKFFQMYARPEAASILCLVDSHSDKFHDYFNVPTQEKSHDIKLQSIHQDDLQIVDQRPPHARRENVFVVDPQTNSPTRYFSQTKDDSAALIGRMPLEELLERAAGADALYVGHFTKNEKHFNYFLHFPNLIKEMSSELMAWLKEDFLEFSVQKGATKDINIFCLDEGTGLINIVELFAREENLRTPQLVLKDDLFAPPVTPEGEIFWFVIPAFASGKTVRWCMEFAGDKAKQIVVSTVIARTDPRSLVFFSKIGAYGQASCRITFFSSFPLVSYDAANCPSCALSIRLNDQLKNCEREFPILARAVEDIIAEFKAVDVQSVNLFGDLTKVPERPDREAYFFSLLKNATTSPELVDTLRVATEDGDCLPCLTIGVGRGVSNEAEIGQIRRILQVSEHLQKVVESRLSQGLPDSNNLYLELRGLLILFPEQVNAQFIKSVINEHYNNKQLIISSIIEVILASTKLWDILTVDSDRVSTELRPLFVEARKYTATRVISTGLEALGNLRGLLIRSHGWQNNLGFIETACGKECSVDELKPLLDRFNKEGYQKAEELFSKFQNSAIWQKLPREIMKGLSEGWETLVATARKIQNVYSLFDVDHASLRDVLTELRKAQRRFVKSIDNLAVRPAKCSQMIDELAKVLGIERSDVSLKLSPDCPSLASTDGILSEIIFNVLDNFAVHTDTGTKIEFEFKRADESFVVLEIRQNAPWTNKRIKGGISRINDALLPFGGRLNIDAGEASGNPKVNIWIPCWPQENVLESKK